MEIVRFPASDAPRETVRDGKREVDRLEARTAAFCTHAAGFKAVRAQRVLANGVKAWLVWVLRVVLRTSA